jgi:ethanolamine ammonia-lyase small subunit
VWNDIFQLKHIPNQSKSLLILGRNSVNENGQNTLPRVQIVGGDTLSAQNIHQQTAEILSNLKRAF